LVILVLGSSSACVFPLFNVDLAIFGVRNLGPKIGKKSHYMVGSMLVKLKAIF
jgi:hypothetical protein